MQRVLENLGEIEAATYYAGLAGSSQTTTTWESKSSEFAARDFDLAANPEDTDGGAEEIDLSGEWEAVWNDVTAESSAQPDPPAIPQPPAAPASSFSEDIPELVEEVRFCLVQQIWSEAETAIARLAAASPSHPDLPTFRAELRQGRPSPDPVDLPNLPSEPLYAPVEVIEVSSDLSSPTSLPPVEPPPPPVLQPPAPAPTLRSLAAELDFELGDSFAPTQQARREPPAPAPSLAPPDPPPLEPVPAPFVPPPAEPVAAPASVFSLDEVDLFQAPPPNPLEAQDLVQYLTADAEPAPDPAMTPSVFGDLLQEFERDLAMPQNDDNDPETHFNLGIAFREMGLLDEAIGELQKVCRLAGQGLSPARTQEAYIWLATCFVEKSVPEASFKWFLRALEAAPDEESRTAVNYELASAYESAGMKREALDHFMDVYGTNIDYRDVATRIRELRSAI
jgi:hypothetical protein